MSVSTRGVRVPPGQGNTRCEVHSSQGLKRSSVPGGPEACRLVGEGTGLLNWRSDTEGFCLPLYPDW